jgi:glutamate dehydrogenase/leucine dehydrogenase
MWDRYRRYLQEPPQIVLEWNDAPTGAKGWLVINSLRGGAAGGGTRMHKGVTLEEVTYLAKTMEQKFAFSGPPIGGAKSGIAFDPRDPRREDVLRRWFESVHPYLQNVYGTGGDVNVDEQRDVMPICRELGLRHHQQGVVKGHLRPDDDEVDQILSCIQIGLRLPIVDAAWAIDGLDLTVSDMITGWGVVEAARSLLEERGTSLEGQRVVVEGFGNVGSSAALYFARAGAQVVGLLDAESFLVAPNGLDSAAVEDLIIRGERRAIPSHPLRRSDHDRSAADSVPADIFVPAAVSGSLNRPRLDRLRAAGVGTIICGANQPISETCLGETATQEYADANFLIVPDMVGSLGMARSFYHLMDRAADHSVAGTFGAVSNAMAESVQAILECQGGGDTGLLAATLQVADARRAEAGS